MLHLWGLGQAEAPGKALGTTHPCTQPENLWSGPPLPGETPPCLSFDLLRPHTFPGSFQGLTYWKAGRGSQLMGVWVGSGGSRHELGGNERKWGVLGWGGG